jgi:hypothetical protein
MYVIDSSSEYFSHCQLNKITVPLLPIAHLSEFITQLPDVTPLPAAKGYAFALLLLLYFTERIMIQMFTTKEKVLVNIIG